MLMGLSISRFWCYNDRAWSHNSDRQTHTVRPRNFHPKSDKSSDTSIDSDYKAEIEQDKQKEKDAVINDFINDTEVNELDHQYTVFSQ
jgi:hypothetical protein